MCSNRRVTALAKRVLLRVEYRTLALCAARLALHYQFLKGQFKAIQLPDLGIGTDDQAQTSR